MWTIHAVSNNNGKQAYDPGKKNICLSGCVISGFSSGNIHVDLQMGSSAFHNSPDPVKGTPFVSIPLDTGKRPKV